MATRTARPAPLISICVVTAGRPELLEACLQSLADQHDAPDFELLVCCNGDAALARRVLARFPDSIVGVTNPALPGAARNLLVERARGDLLLFLDDDVVAHPKLLNRIASVARAWPAAGVFGGPNETPPGSSRFEIVQGAVLASLVGSGPARRRYGRHAAGPADQRFFTLCNLSVRREAMLPFSTELVCAEENMLLEQLARRGVSMRYDPDLIVFHQRRPTARAFLSQMVKYGRGRGQLTVRAPSTLRPAFAMPVALLVYLVSAPALAMIDSLWLIPLGLYATTLAAGAMRVAWTLRRPTAAFAAAGLMLLLHVGYGAGIVAGLFAPRRAPDAESDLCWAPVTLGTACR